MATAAHHVVGDVRRIRSARRSSGTRTAPSPRRASRVSWSVSRSPVKASASIEGFARIDGQPAVRIGVGIVVGREGVAGAQVDDACLPAGIDAKRQFAVAARAARGAHVRQEKRAAAMVDPHARLQRAERRPCAAGRIVAAHRDRILARRIRQPAERAVVEHDVPLAPRAGVVGHLDAPEHRERTLSVATGRTDLDRRRIVEHRRQFADAFDVGAALEQRAATERADGHHRRRRAKLDRRAALGHEVLNMRDAYRVSFAGSRPSRANIRLRSRGPCRTAPSTVRAAA